MHWFIWSSLVGAVKSFAGLTLQMLKPSDQYKFDNPTTRRQAGANGLAAILCTTLFCSVAFGCCWSVLKLQKRTSGIYHSCRTAWIWIALYAAGNSLMTYIDWYMFLRFPVRLALWPVLISTAIFWSWLFDRYLFRDRFKPGSWRGFSTFCVGVLVANGTVFWNIYKGEAEIGGAMWILLALLSAIFIAFNQCCTKRLSEARPKDLDAMQVLASSFAETALLYGLASLAVAGILFSLFLLQPFDISVVVGSLQQKWLWFVLLVGSIVAIPIFRVASFKERKDGTRAKVTDQAMCTLIAQFLAGQAFHCVATGSISPDLVVLCGAVICSLGAWDFLRTVESDK